MVAAYLFARRISVYRGSLHTFSRRCASCRRPIAAMADTLETQLQKLHIDQPDLPDCFPSLNPFDVYRIYISNILSDLSGVQPKIIYSALQRTATLDKGDLLLPVPALRIKGGKPCVLATRWADQVLTTDIPRSTV